MAGVELGVQVDAEQVTRLLEQAPEATQKRLRQLIEAAAIDVQREMRIDSPVAVTGALRNSVTYTMDVASLTATVQPTSPYADDVEFGGPPRMVSVAPGTPLRDWAELKGINPYALQHSIAAKGTQAHPFIGPVYDRLLQPIQSQLAAGVREFAQELDRGEL